MKQSIIYSYFTVSPITSKIKDDQENYNVKSNLNIQNPHDKFFKETFGNSALAKDFLQNYLPQDILQVIDLQTIKPQKDTFINLHLQEYFSDLLFETNINDYAGYIYLLFEHKSYPDKNIPLQLLNYMLHIWQEKIDKQLQLPIVIPLVIYHGKNKWNVTENLGTMIEDYNVLSKEMRRFIPNFKYLVYDLSQFSDDEIKGSLQLKAYLTICRDILTNNTNDFIDSIVRALSFLQQIDHKDLRLKYIKGLFTYIFNARKNFTQHEVDKVIKKIPEGSDVSMTLAELYRKEGRQEAKISVAQNLILKGFSIEDIVEITQLSHGDVDKIKKEINYNQ